MSFFDSTAPSCAASGGAIELMIRPKRKDLGEFSVARALPAPERRMVGPFIFFDHMGPANFGPGQGIQVRPHPHIGIATITYLFEGLVMHRDSLGYAQAIEPGAVNLMVAGRGIVHSERAAEDLAVPSRLHGIQSWLALPDGELEREPAFTHYGAKEIPRLDIGGVGVHLIMGECFGVSSPVASFSPTLYIESIMPAGSRLLVPAPVPERAAYVVSGEVSVDGVVLHEGTMAVLAAGAPVEIAAAKSSRLMLLGGAPVGPRELWWNFVAPSWERIEQAKADWAEGRFDKIQGDDEFIPLPQD